MIRIAFVSDTHADVNSRWDEHCRVMGWLATDIAGRSVDLVCHGGDVFDGQSNPTERTFVAEWIRSIAEFSPIAIVAGNHDKALDTKFLQRLLTKHPIIAAEDPGVHLIGGVAVGVLPWPRKAQLLAALGKPVAPEESGRIAVEALKARLTEIGAGLQSHARPRVLLSHSMITGSKTDSRQPIVGADMEVSIADLALSRAHLIVAGHVHAEQHWILDDVPIIYPGCPMHRTFGEPGPTSYVIAEFEGEKLLQWMRVIVPARPMLLLKAQWDGHALVGPHRLIDVAGSEIRVQFSVPVDQREAAEICAAEDRKVMLERGAALVKMDPQVETTTRARAPEVATARNLIDKLDVLWQCRGVSVDPLRRSRLVDRLSILESEVPASTSARGSIRFDRIRGRGLGTLKEFDVDVSALAGPIVAVCGLNGEGKSTFLELFLGALTRKTPTRGTLADLAMTRDAYVEASVVNGAAYTIRQTVDAQSGEGESFCADAKGKPVLETSGITPFKAWAKAHLPAQEVLCCSQFMPQGSGGFLDMDPTPRKGTILRVLGIERYEALAKAAREHATGTSTRLDLLVARIAEEQSRGSDVEAVEAELEAASKEAVEASAQLAAAKAALASALKEHDRILRAHQDTEQLLERRAAVQQRLTAAEAKRGDLASRRDANVGIVSRAADIREAVERVSALSSKVSDLQTTQARITAEADAAGKERAEHVRRSEEAAERASQAAARAKAHRDGLDESIKSLRKEAAETEEKIANNRMLLEQADEIGAAVARDQELAQEAAKVETEANQAQRDLDRAMLDGDDHEQRRAEATTRKASADKRAAAARERLTSRDAIESAAALLPRLRELVNVANENVTRVEADLEELRGKTVAGSQERIGALRGALVIIADPDACRVEEIVARDALTVDDAAVTMASELPGRIRDGAARVAVAKKELENARQQLADAERLAARAGEIVQAEAEIKTAGADAGAADQQAKTEAENSARAQWMVVHLTAARKTAWDRGAEIAEQRKPLALKVKRAEKLSQAEARIETLAPQLESTRTKIAQLETTIAALPAVDPEVEAANLAAANAIALETAAAERLALARTELDRIGGVLLELTKERDNLVPLANELGELTKAEAIATELRSQVAAAEADASTIAAELAAIPEPGNIVLPDTSEAEKSVQRAELASIEKLTHVHVVEGKLEGTFGRRAKLEAYALERTQVEDELSDWTRLAQDLGKDGLQSLEVDAAGPELTDLINDLLRCAGTRWTVFVETARMSEDGKKQIEGCEIRVLDTKTGLERPADRLSGGERVLVGEAVSLALAMLACKRAGMEGITLVRDESGAALDEIRAPLYLAMMRRAVEIVKADKLLFVSHNSNVQDLADSRIQISNGLIEVG